MRFIDRDRMTPPALLFDKRIDAAREEIESFIVQTSSKGGTRRTPQSDWLDHDEEFRSAMASLFGHRCAYCETGTDGPSKGLVGRHRPSMLAEDEKGNTELLAYCWLIYDWENLLWLCQTCASLKGNRFFIYGDRGEPFATIEELRGSEAERVIDPCHHRPSEHLAFQIGGSLSGKSTIGATTISLLRLNRPNLTQGRQEAIRTFAEALRSGGVQYDGEMMTPTPGREVILTAADEARFVRL